MSSTLWCAVFQLHHTGIKTNFVRFSWLLFLLFQLHHTGIKTRSSGWVRVDTNNFNCTIQELKHGFTSFVIELPLYFNCTIQELKHAYCTISRTCSCVFQLHHTGIKTRARSRR